MSSLVIEIIVNLVVEMSSVIILFAPMRIAVSTVIFELGVQA